MKCLDTSRINISTGPFGPTPRPAFSSAFTVQLCKSILAGQDEYKGHSTDIGPPAFVPVCLTTPSAEFYSKNIPYYLSVITYISS